jgi:hypothetical protein
LHLFASLRLVRFSLKKQLQHLVPGFYKTPAQSTFAARSLVQNLLSWRSLINPNPFGLISSSEIPQPAS